MKVILMIGENKVELDGVTDIKVENNERDTLNVETEENIYYRLDSKSEVFSLNENKNITFEKNIILKLLDEGILFEYFMEDSLGDKYRVSANVINHGLKKVVDDGSTDMLFKQSKDKRLIMAKN
ncbi:hypothetical protein HB162lentus_02010 [Mammaliicoccus lentus]